MGLSSFIDSALAAFGPELRSIILYGSGAEGRLRPASDVNLVFVLASFDAAKADALREPFAAAHAAIRVSVMFLLESEVGQAMESFGQIGLEMAARSFARKRAVKTGRGRVG